MSRKRAIDVQRDAAFSMRVGGDDHSGIMHHLSTGNALYIIKEEGVYQLKTADDIDPERLNPHIPHQNQQILPAGYNNEIVGKILLTAKTLFDNHNAGPPPINESISGVNPDKIWIIYRRHINGKEALYG